MTTSHCILLLSLVLCVIGVQSLNLANSSYPIYKANRERNNQLNGNIVCSYVTPGRTTVLNDTWASTDTRQLDTLPPILAQDYFYILFSNVGSDYTLRQHDIAGKSPIRWDYLTKAVPTILQDGSVAISNQTHTVLLKTDRTELFTPIPNFDTNGYEHLIPYQDTLLLRPDTSYQSGLVWVLDLTNDVSNAHWTANISCSGTIRNVMVYSPSGVDLFIVAADFESGSGVNLCVGSNSYTINGASMNDYVAPFISEGILYVALDNSSISLFDLETKTFTGAVSWNSGYLETSIIARGSKIIASLKSTAQGNIIVELRSNKTIMTNRKFAGDPTFSIPDNAVVFTAMGDDDVQELMVLDWDTWEVKAAGLFDQLSTMTSVAEAVFDENCNVFVTSGNGIVHKFVPLPITDVVPIIDCIDEFNVAYFTYKNNGYDDGFRIPYIVDRNALSPDNIAPVTLFNTGEGLHYPFSARVQLQNASATYQWRLEDYLLTFSVTPQLACPRNVSITLTFTAMDKFNETSFVQIVVDAFVSVTGIRGTRVFVVSVSTQNNVAKRMIRQGQPTLELELEVAAGNSSEPTSAEVVKNLIKYQTDQLSNEVSSNPDVPTDTQLYGLVPKAPVTSQSGVLTQYVPPVAPITNIPLSQPSTNTNAPQSTPIQPTSSGSRVMHLGLVALTVVNLFLTL